MADKVKRMRYFNGLFLREEEFNLEQNYNIRMRRLHNRRMHSWGIVYGLDVRNGPGEKEVTVEKGMALNKVLDDEGEEASQEIVLHQDAAVDLSGYSPGDRVYIYISYSEEKDYRSTIEVGSGEDKENDAIYWWERAVIGHSAAEPQDKTEKIMLARVLINEEGIINKGCITYTEDDQSIRTYAGFAGKIIETEKLTFSLEGQISGLPSMQGKQIGAQNGILIDSPRTSLSGSLIVEGDLEIKGTSTTVNTKTIEVEDNVITLNKYAPQKKPKDINGGIEVFRGGTAKNAQLIWDEEADRWKIGVEGGLTDICYGAKWDQLTNASLADALHRHSELYNADGSGQVLSINKSGNVGIGTDKPGAKLEIAGDLKITGGAICNSSGFSIVQTNKDDWLRINPGSQFPAIALYKSVAIGTGGLAIGVWTKKLSNGELRVTGSASLATDTGSVGIGTDKPQGRLDINDGVLKVGNNYFNVLAYNHNDRIKNGVKIKTNIPFTSNSQMPLIIIEGFAYSADTIGLLLKWFIDKDNFVHYHVSSFGSYIPEIRLARENDKVVIFINDKGYYHRFSVRAFAQGIKEEPAWFVDWGVADEEITGDKVVTVPYKNNFSGKIGIGTDKPEAELDVRGFARTLGIAVNDGTNSGVGRGVWLWNVGNSNHVIYIAHPNGKSPADATPARGYFDAKHRLRFRTNVSQGFLFENSKETALVDIDSDDGRLWTKGGIYAGNSDLYFTNTEHNHTAIGNTAGYAAIENAKNYDALMILGRAGTGKGRSVRLWDYLQVNGQLDVTKNINVGSLTFSGFTDKDQDEWPNFIWYRDTAKNWDEGLIKHSSKRGRFKKSGFGIHFDENREFGFWSTHWTPLFAVEGGSGDSYIKGDLLLGGSLSIGQIQDKYKLYVNGDVYVTGKVYAKDFIKNLPAGGVTASDKRWKRDIAPLGDSLKKVTALQGISFEWKKREYPELGFPEGRQIGLIAQDVEKVVPEVVNTDDKGYKSLSYERLTAVLIEAIKEQQAQIEELKGKVPAV